MVRIIARPGVRQNRHGPLQLRHKLEWLNDPQMIRSKILSLLIAAGVAVSAAGVSHAADLKVITANGLRKVLDETRAQFEQASGHRITVIVTETGEIRRRLLAGEAFDVVVVPRDVAEELEQAGKVAPGSALILARDRFGLAVASDGPRPDVSTPEALKQTLLAARTVLITDPERGAISGVHFMNVITKLGIAEQMKGKIVANPGGNFHAQRVVTGEADLAVQTEHEIRCVKGATFLPYPAVFQRTVIFVGAISAAARNATAASAYLGFLTGANITNAYVAHCLTRG